MIVEEHIITEAKKYHPEDINCYKVSLHGVEFAGKLSPWISVKDDLPYKHEELIPNKEYKVMTKVVLIKTKERVKNKERVKKSFMIRDVINDTWVWCNYVNNEDQITHWVPFPENN